MRLEALDGHGDSRVYRDHAGSGDAIAQQVRAEQIVKTIATSQVKTTSTEPVAFEGGIFVPLAVHHGLGHGWLYLCDVAIDELASKSLALLAGHASNALYSNIAQHNLQEREGDVFDEIAI